MDASLPPTPITKGSPFFLLCYLPAGSLTQASLIFKKGYNFSSSSYEIKSGVTSVGCPGKDIVKLNLFHVCKSVYSGGSMMTDLWTQSIGVGLCKHSGEVGVPFA